MDKERKGFKMENLRVSDVCQPCSLTLAVREDEGIEAVIRRFASEPETHALFVVDKKGKLKGLVKIRHILNWVRLKIGAGRERHGFTVSEAFEAIKLAQSTKIGEIGSPPITVKPDDSLAHVLNLMAAEEVVEVAVIDEEGQLLGEIKLPLLLSRLLDTHKPRPKKAKKK